MRSLFIRSALAFIVLSSLVKFVDAQVDIGVSIGDQGLKSFYLAVGDHYKVPEKEVIVIKERRVPDEEIPVVLYIAQMARVTPKAVIDLRLIGRTWMDITLHYGLSPEIFYVPVNPEVIYVPVIVEQGPPYGKAHGHHHFNRKLKRECKTVVFRDNDIIDLVNLKFTSEHYRRSPEEVIKMREQGKTFVEINDRFKNPGKDRGQKEEIKQKKEKARVRKEGREREEGRGKGKGREKGKG